MNLSPHFTFEELTITRHLEHIEANTQWGREHGAALRRLALDLCEPVRAALQLEGRAVPIIVSSGIRCPALNKAVGGQGTGESGPHPEGRAIDFIAPAFGSPYDIARALSGETENGARSLAAAGVDFDQLIYEHTWIHASLPRVGVPGRRQVMTLMPGNTWQFGIHPRG